jgi:hypothetical protein
MAGDASRSIKKNLLELRLVSGIIILIFPPANRATPPRPILADQRTVMPNAQRTNP